MKSILIDKFGGPEVLIIKDVELGKPGPNDVLIKNLSIGLNFIDIYHRTGLYPIPLPSGIGLEACGVIEEVGSEVSEFNKGDNIAYASVPLGAYSQQRIIPAKIVVKVPDGMSDEEATLCLTAGTSMYTLDVMGGLYAGQTIVITGPGPIGLCAVGVANALGAEVILTGTRDNRLEIGKKLGYRFVIKGSKYKDDYIYFKVANVGWGKSFKSRGVSIKIEDKIFKSDIDIKNWKPGNEYIEKIYVGKQKVEFGTLIIEEEVKFANTTGTALIFSKTRHFRH